MAVSDGLDRMKTLLDALGHPEADFRVIHIAGTNGKGSTAVMTASILEEAGYSVGLYTSPHLESECERVQIWDGEHHLIDQTHFDELKDIARSACGGLTVFEVYTAAAYLYFDEMKPDYVVLETGLGGRLDSTNTIEKPLVSVITQIGLDHTAELGNTIFKITREKAGIIKKGVPVVSQTGDLNVKNILRRTAAENGCAFTDVSLLTAKYSSYVTGMKGEHQKANAATAAEAVKAAGIEVTDEAVRKGLAKAYLPGRFDVLNEAEGGENGPFFIVDGAHNPDAVDRLTDTFNSFARSYKIKRTLLIFGCMRDKNSTRMIQLLLAKLKGCTYAAAAVDYGRAEDPSVIGERIVSGGRGCVVCDSVSEAYEVAMKGNYQCVLVTGSIYLAGEMRSLYLQEHKSL